MDEHNPDVVARQLERLEERRVAAAHHRDELAAVQRPVAARAVAQALALEVVLSLHSELSRVRPGGHDDSGGDDLAGVRSDGPVAVALLDPRRLGHLYRAARVRHLLLHPRAELEAGHAFREAGEVLDALGVHDRSAHSERVDEDGAAAMPRREEGGREPGIPSADDRDLVVRHAPLTPS